MNEVIKAIKERRSIRKFKPDMPEKAELEQIIESGLYHSISHFSFKYQPNPVLM